MSEFVPTADGGLLIYMGKRDPVDETQLKKEIDNQRMMLRTRKRYALFVQWLQAGRKGADVQSLIDQRRGS